MNSLLFHGADLLDISAGRLKAITDDIQNLSAAIMRDQDEAFAAIMKRARLDPVVLDKAVATTEQAEVSGGRELQCIVTLPFTGSPDLFRSRPSSFTLNPPQGELDGNKIVFSAVFPNSIDQEQIRAWRGQNVANIESWLGFANADAEAHNVAAAGRTREEYGRRRENLNRIETLNKELGEGV